MPSDLTQFLNSPSEILEKSIFSKRKVKNIEKISNNAAINLIHGFLIIFVMMKRWRQGRAYCSFQNL